MRERFGICQEVRCADGAELEEGTEMIEEKPLSAGVIRDVRLCYCIGSESDTVVAQEGKPYC